MHTTLAHHHASGKVTPASTSSSVADATPASPPPAQTQTQNLFTSPELSPSGVQGECPHFSREEEKPEFGPFERR